MKTKTGLSVAKGLGVLVVSLSFNISMKAIVTNYPGQKRDRFYNGCFII